MTRGEFSHLLSSLPDLSPDQMQTLFRELESRLKAARPPRNTARATNGEETAFEVAQRAGLIGCIEGAPGSPTDLSTNPKHRDGFGRG